MSLDAEERYREAIREFLSTSEGRLLLNSIIERDVKALVTDVVRKITRNSTELTSLLISKMTHRYGAETIDRVDSLIKASVSEGNANTKINEMATRIMKANNSRKMFSICLLKLVNGVLQADSHLFTHQEGIEVTRISKPYSADEHYTTTKGTVAVHARIMESSKQYRTVCIELFNNTESSVSVFCLSEMETLKPVNKLVYNKTSIIEVKTSVKEEYKIRVPNVRSSDNTENIFVEVFVF